MSFDVVEILKIIFIGIIEGVTEWLPISSTGHMLLFDEFIPLDMSEKFKEMFFVVIQFGAILAVVVYFWKRLIPIECKNKKIQVKTETVILWLHIAVACIPAAVSGLILDDFLEEHFGSAITVSVMLIVYGVAFILVERRKKEPKINSINDINYKLALLIGCFQALSMIPGTSRSGATIIGALLSGVSRTVAAEFTFFLAVPTMFGASLLKLMKFGFDFSSTEVFALVLGMSVAFAVSLAAIKFLMDFVRKHDFTAFGFYRIILGIIVILISVIR